MRKSRGEIRNCVAQNAIDVYALQIAEQELARERLREILEPRIKATLAEGLSKEDINKVISKILKEV